MFKIIFFFNITLPIIFRKKIKISLCFIDTRKIQLLIENASHDFPVISFQILFIYLFILGGSDEFSVTEGVFRCLQNLGFFFFIKSRRVVCFCFPNFHVTLNADQNINELVIMGYTCILKIFNFCSWYSSVVTMSINLIKNICMIRIHNIYNSVWLIDC